MKVRLGSARNRRASKQVGTWLATLALFSPFVVGCRTPWRQSAPAEPSFDRLIEIEQKNSDPPSRETISALRRPGGIPTARRVSSSAETARDEALATGEQLDGSPENELLRRQMIAAENLLLSRERPDESSPRPRPKPSDGDVTTFRLSDDVDAPQPAETVASSLTADKGEVGQASCASSKPDEGVALAVGRDDATAAGVQTNPTDRSEVALAGASRSANGPAPGATSADSSLKNPAVVEEVELEWRDRVRQAIAQLETLAAASTNPEQQVNLEKNIRLLDLAVGDLERAMTPVSGLNKDAQEYLRYSLQAWHDLSDPNGNPIARQRYTLALQSQRKAQQHLASASDLEVRNAAFCTAVDSYGVISTFPENSFHRDQQLLLYCEVDNFVSLPVPNGKGFETHLQGRYEIVDASGARIEDQPLPPDQHVSNNARRDYFIVYRIWTPKSIAPGRYRLNLTIEDLNGHKFGHSSVEFQVVQ